MPRVVGGVLHESRGARRSMRGQALAWVERQPVGRPGERQPVGRPAGSCRSLPVSASCVLCGQSRVNRPQRKGNNMCYRGVTIRSLANGILSTQDSQNIDTGISSKQYHLLRTSGGPASVSWEERASRRRSRKTTGRWKTVTVMGPLCASCSSTTSTAPSWSACV